MTVLAALLGVSAGLVGVFDTVPYLRDVMRVIDPPTPGNVADLERARRRRLPGAVGG